MKKLLISFIAIILFAAAMPIVTSVYAQGRGYSNSYNSKNYKKARKRYKKQQKRQRQALRYNAINRNNYDYANRRSENTRYNQQPYYNSRNRSVYSRHRNVRNIAIGTGAGAIIGGILGGKRGALIGAGVGAGAGAAYTYGIRPKKKRYRNNRRYRGRP